MKTPKLYWVDVGLWRHMTETYGPASGALFETFVASEVLKWLRTTGVDARPSFYRTRSGIEVDLLIESNGKVLGMEVRTAERVGPSDATALNWLAATMDAEWRSGLVVYRGERLFWIAPQTWAVPSWRFLS